MLPHYILVGFLLLLLYFAFLMLKPFLTALILGVMFGYLLYPLFSKLLNKWNRPHLAASSITTLSVLVFAVPLPWIIRKLVVESRNAYIMIANTDWNFLGDYLAPIGLDPNNFLQDIAGGVRDYFIDATPTIVGSFATGVIGIFLMFFTMYFTFLKGPEWVELVREWLPLNPKQRKELLKQIAEITDGVMYGQVLTSVIQGLLGGIMFWIFDVPNPVFWGVLMTFFAFVPILGTPFVWLPAAAIKYINGSTWDALGILLVGGIVVMNIDNLVRPYLIGTKARVSFPVVLLGVIGGLQFFGLIGLLLGPMILVLLHTVVRFLKESKMALFE